jgi:predicted kinase
MPRKVIFIRGAQGSGKTTIMRRAGLEGFNVSQDKIRNIVGGDTLNVNGDFVLNHENEPLVFKLFTESIDRRIARGEVICIDGTLANGAQLYDHWKKFDEAGYEGLVVDLYGFDEELRYERNNARSERERVPEGSVAKMMSMASKSPIPPIMRDNPALAFITPHTDAEATEAVVSMKAFLRDRRCTRDLSAYDRIVHIGDLQGCHAPLVDPASPLKDGLDPRTFYVFAGDLFDRGIQNGEVGVWFMKHCVDQPNVALIAGNHEDYVEKQARADGDDIGLPDSEWSRFSWPELKAAGLNRQDCKRIADMSQDYLAYKWHDKKVLCTHAGFGRWPSDMSLISTHQMRRGNGRYEIDVDASWSAAEAETGRFQVHGHRNSSMKPTISSALSINLEAQIEFGGHLRIATLDESGFTPTDIRSKVHRTMQDDIAANMAVNRTSSSKHAPLVPWVKRGEPLTEVSDGLIDKMENHDMIGLRNSETYPGVFSVNFTNRAFNDAAWDDYTMVARGLYIDGETSTVVARGHEKFFNLNERPETQADTMGERVTFPVIAYEKANGFFGITGYSERLGELVIASKSVTEGTFPDIARDVIMDSIGEDGMERLLRFNRDQQASLLFEIEDPQRDPHIIDLEKPRIVLLSCIRRSEVFEQAPYGDLVAIGKWLGCEVKECIATLPNERALASFNHRVERDPNWKYKGKHLEGCVMEDASGFFYKLKSDHYRNWKRMRSAVNHIRKAKLVGNEPSTARYADMDEKYQEFMEWAKDLPVEALGNDIIALRNSFQGDRSIMENVEDTHAEEVAEAKMVEWAKNYSALIEKVATNERTSEEGFKKFVTVTMDDPEKLKVLEGHPRYEEIMERCGFRDDEPSM